MNKTNLTRYTKKCFLKWDFRKKCGLDFVGKMWYNNKIKKNAIQKGKSEEVYVKTTCEMHKGISALCCLNADLYYRGGGN